MSQLVARNTIKLASGASAVNDYYNSYSIIVTRFNTITGKKIVQKKEIISYDGTEKIATIDGLWDIDYIPNNTDTYEIIPTYPDSRVSINPAIQSLDYITSDRYGRGLDAHKDLNLSSWLESARICDAQSDVTVEIIGTLPEIGAVYKYGNIIFQGKVIEVNGQFVTFTDVIGKLTNKWNNWKSYEVNEFVYEDDRLYIVTSADIKTTKPTHTSGTVNGLNYVTTSYNLEKVSGNGTTTIDLTFDGNPVRTVKNGVKTSGYSLYDSDGVDYFRLLGWNSHSQREVTRHQCNITIDTALPLFDNMNSLLEHFGGILRYSGEKYTLEVEQSEGQIANSDDEPRNIGADHIIGKIRLNDDGMRNSYNSLTVAYADPANKYEARNISFFNSDYLKADRNVPKKGNVSIPGITNYYNARILADKYLEKSRFALNISMQIVPSGMLLVAGRVIQVQYPRYDWVNKKFRIENLTHNEDCTVDIVAQEYDDSFYIISNISRQPASSLAGSRKITTAPGPFGLVATSIDSNNESISGIELKWTNDPTISGTNITTEIFASTAPNLYVLITSITESNILNTTVAHNLTVGELITAKTGLNGFDENKNYYIKTVTPTSFTLAESKGGATLTFINGVNLNLTMLTASIVGTVNPPESSYIDTYTGAAIDRVEKNYWIRYRITQE